jgi:hypothetical protein
MASKEIAREDHLSFAGIKRWAGAVRRCSADRPRPSSIKAEGGPMTEATRPAWETALFCLLHPAQVAVVEAHLWMREPLSAPVLHEVLSHEWPLGTVSYHVRRLAAAGVLEELYTTPARGAVEIHHGLARS